MNKITLIGNLTADPELRATTAGVNVCTFSIAVNRRNGKTDFIKINAWRALGEACQKYLSKGKKVAVIGELQISQVDGKNGKQTFVDVQADEVEFLSPKNTQEEFVEINPEGLPF